jgi:uncharacterized membrane protein (Fun14 family)
VSVIAKRTPLNVKTVRSGIESIALIIGFSLGGTVGMGTAVMALTVGFFVNLAFRLAKFDITKIEHSFIDDIILKAMNKNISVKDINIYYNPVFLDAFMSK